MKPATVGLHAGDSPEADVRQESAARANRYDVVSRLADDLAHEIKNPLNAIVVNLEVLRRKIETGATQVAVERTRVIDEEIARLHLLVDQLLQLLRPARTDGQITAVHEVLEELRLLWEVQARAARVEFSLAAETDLYTKVTSDVVKFAMLNLVTALYSTPARLERITIGAHTHAGAVELTTASTPEVLQRDDQFVQAARTLIETAGGTLEVGNGIAVLRIPASSSFA